jgi:hypothetical protein
MQSNDVQFWDGAERQVLAKLIHADPTGFEKSMDEMALISWLRRTVEESDESGFDIPWQAVLAVKVKWKHLSDKDPSLLPFYHAWHVSKEGAASILANFR